MEYQFLEHTADILYEAYGATFKEALETAAKVLFEETADLKQVNSTKKVAIKEKAKTLDELAAFVLSDLVAERDARGLFFKSFKIDSLEQTRNGFTLNGTVEGGPATRDAGKTEVKAVTHHETKAFEKDGKWTIRVLLDI
ncbi:archease [Candidatus Micrarchaeota archaeon]|nr:archease [Candidatus Micrarchaeota archaeon]